MNTRRVWSRIAATAALSLLSFAGIARADQEYDSSEVMVPMRDGIRLHTVLIRPRRAGPSLFVLL
jgi:predicted acyl esterase